MFVTRNSDFLEKEFLRRGKMDRRFILKKFKMSQLGITLQVMLT